MAINRDECDCDDDDYLAIIITESNDDYDYDKDDYLAIITEESPGSSTARSRIKSNGSINCLATSSKTATLEATCSAVPDVRL